MSAHEDDEGEHPDASDINIEQVRAFMESRREPTVEDALRSLLAVIHSDGGQHTVAVGLAQSVEDAKARWYERAEAADALAAAQALATEAEHGREHAHYWYGCRWERLRDLLRETSLWPQAAAIMANGTADPHEPPTYAQQLNMAIHRAEAAEQARDDARVEVARLDAVLIARQDAELKAGPPSEMELRLLHATREVARLRARVRVEAEDVEQAGVAPAKVRAWLRVHDLPAESDVVHGERWCGYGWLRHSDRPRDIATAIGNLARQLGRPGLDILDEMAATEVPDGK